MWGRLLRQGTPLESLPQNAFFCSALWRDWRPLIANSHFDISSSQESFLGCNSSLMCSIHADGKIENDKQCCPSLSLSLSLYCCCRSCTIDTTTTTSTDGSNNCRSQRLVLSTDLGQVWLAEFSKAALR